MFSNQEWETGRQPFNPWPCRACGVQIPKGATVWKMRLGCHCSSEPMLCLFVERVWMWVDMAELKPFVEKKVGYSIYEQALRFTNNTLKSANKASKASIHTTGPVIERITQVLITFAVQKVVWGTSLWRTTLRSQTVGKEAMQIRQHTFYTSSTCHHHPCVSRVSGALDFVQTLLWSSVENCVTEDKFLFLFCKSTK